MDWIQVSIYTTSEGIEPVSGRLLQLGISGIEIEDEADFKDFHKKCIELRRMLVSTVTTLKSK